MSDDDAERALTELIVAGTSFALGTVDESGEPRVGYVPYACTAGAFVFVVSGLAAHARHLAAHETISGLIVGPAMADPYSRVRLTTLGPARPLAPDTPAAAGAWAALERRHGATVALLRTLPDFGAYAHAPENGRLVVGFAMAYDFTSDALAAAVRAAENA